jgi:hypothetical protein
LAPAENRCEESPEANDRGEHSPLLLEHRYEMKKPLVVLASNLRVPVDQQRLGRRIVVQREQEVRATDRIVQRLCAPTRDLGRVGLLGGREAGTPVLEVAN